MRTRIRRWLARQLYQGAHRLEDLADRVNVSATPEEMDELTIHCARLNGRIAKALAETNPWLNVMNGGTFPKDTDEPR